MITAKNKAQSVSVSIQNDITLVTIFAWDRVDGATSLIFRFRKQIPE